MAAARGRPPAPRAARRSRARRRASRPPLRTRGTRGSRAGPFGARSERPGIGLDHAVAAQEPEVGAERGGLAGDGALREAAGREVREVAPQRRVVERGRVGAAAAVGPGDELADVARVRVARVLARRRERRDVPVDLPGLGGGAHSRTPAPGTELLAGRIRRAPRTRRNAAADIRDPMLAVTVRRTCARRHQPPSRRDAGLQVTNTGGRSRTARDHGPLSHPPVRAVPAVEAPRPSHRSYHCDASWGLRPIRPEPWMEVTVLASLRSATLVGVDGRPVRVEVHVSTGLPAYHVVGLPDASGRESRERVRAALLSSDLPWPMQRITVNLAPGGLRKTGAGFELAVAIGLLVAAEAPPRIGRGRPRRARRARPRRLGPARAGRARPGRRAAPGRLSTRRRAARQRGRGRARRRRRDLPRPHARRAARVPAGRRRVARRPRAAAPPGPQATPSPTSRSTSPTSAASPPRGSRWPRRPRVATTCSSSDRPAPARRCSPGGCRRSCRRCPRDAALEVTRIHSVAGRSPGHALADRPPFRAPHHTASTAALVGGGSGRPTPGEVTLAHHGILFLDELGEFAPTTLDALRQPLEDGVVRIARQGTTLAFPARFVLVACTNPCPCGLGALCVPVRPGPTRARTAGACPRRCSTASTSGCGSSRATPANRPASRPRSRASG